MLVFDDKGPAEVKEFYAPPLEAYRLASQALKLEACRYELYMQMGRSDPNLELGTMRVT